MISWNLIQEQNSANLFLDWRMINRDICNSWIQIHVERMCLAEGTFVLPTTSLFSPAWNSSGPKSPRKSFRRPRSRYTALAARQLSALIVPAYHPSLRALTLTYLHLRLLPISCDCHNIISIFRGTLYQIRLLMSLHLIYCREYYSISPVPLSPGNF